MKKISKICFAFASFSLMLLALFFVILGLYSFISSLFCFSENMRASIVEAISYVVIALALFDVAKYFYEEEVSHKNNNKTSSDQKNSLIKFITTIIIAVFTEGLVGIFEVSKSRLSDIQYPLLLIAMATVMIIALGIYQYLSSLSEKR